MSEDALKRILLLDDSADYRNLIKLFVKKLMPDIEVVEHDPVAKGIPGEDFPWGDYDVLLLDFDLSIPGVTGLDILQKNHKRPDFPATIMLTGAGTEEVALRALKFGIYEYQSKQSLTKDKLKELLHRAHTTRKEHRVQEELKQEQTSAFSKEVFYEKLRIANGNPESGRVLMVIQLDNVQDIETNIGVIGRDSLVNFVGKKCFNMFKLGEFNPNITRVGDNDIALQINFPDSIDTLARNMDGLCKNLDKTAFKFADLKVGFSVSIGLLKLGIVNCSNQQLIDLTLEAAQRASDEVSNSYYIWKEEDIHKELHGSAEDQEVARDNLQQKLKEIAARKAKAGKQALQEHDEEIQAAAENRAEHEERARLEAEQRAEQEAQQRREAEIKAETEAKSKAELEARLKQLEEESARREQEREAELAAQQQRQAEQAAEAEEKARAELDAKLKELEAERAKHEQEQQAEREAQHKKEAELKADAASKAELEAKLKELEAKGVQREQEQQAEREALQKREAELIAEAEHKAKAEVESRLSQLEQENAKREQEQQAEFQAQQQREAELKTAIEAEIKAKTALEEEMKATREARDKMEADLKAISEAKDKAEAEMKAMQEQKVRLEQDLKNAFSLSPDAGATEPVLDAATPAPAPATATPTPATSAPAAPAPASTAAATTPAATEASNPAAAPAAAPATENKPEEPAEQQADVTAIEANIQTMLSENRIVQTYQPIVLMGEASDEGEEADVEIYQTGMQCVDEEDDTDINEWLVDISRLSLETQQSLQEFMLRQAFARITERETGDLPFRFVINVTAVWFADIKLFQWLQTILTQTKSYDPGKAFILNIPLPLYKEHEKRAAALIDTLRKSHHFKIALSDFGDGKEIESICDAASARFINTNLDGLKQLASRLAPAEKKTAADEEQEKRNLLQHLKAKNIRFVSSGIHDATTLTEAITLGADFTVGDFVGEVQQSLIESSSVESFELT